ncbi:MAG: GTP-binding protein [Desulfobacterales bacterium]|nr:GTP-binding protein [Desulfobacterales bacterium]
MNDPRTSQRGGKIEIILLSGFLGAGKTTLLKQILSRTEDLSDTAVLVNEFGEVGVDGALLKDSGSEVVELASGCICCTLMGDLRKTLKIIRDQYHPRRILIESSGVADPESIASVLQEPELGESMALKKIITVLEADLWEAREAFGRLFYSQLGMADLILLNKIDLIDKERIPLFLKEIHETVPDSRVVPVIHCHVDPETLWTAAKPRLPGLKPIHFFKQASLDGGAEKSGPARGAKSLAGAENFVSFSFQSEEPLDEAGFKRFVEELPWEVFRMKGPVRFESGTKMVNFVGGKSEWTPWDDDSDTRLAFIGWDIDGEKILRRLKDRVG